MSKRLHKGVLVDRVDLTTFDPELYEAVLCGYQERLYEENFVIEWDGDLRRNVYSVLDLNRRGIFDFLARQKGDFELRGSSGGDFVMARDKYSLILVE